MAKRMPLRVCRQRASAAQGSLGYGSVNQKRTAGQPAERDAKGAENAELADSQGSAQPGQGARWPRAGGRADVRRGARLTSVPANRLGLAVACGPGSRPAAAEHGRWATGDGRHRGKGHSGIPCWRGRGAVAGPPGWLSARDKLSLARSQERTRGSFGRRAPGGRR
jgi:hypothetical protein